MSSSRLVRSSKSRLFVYICAVFAFGMVVYMFHGSQLQLDDNRRAIAACNQQTESLSAQLQVIFEYKLRLEKSLQKEKTDHKQTKDECIGRAKQEKEDRDRELLEAANKYSALKQNANLLESKQKDLTEELSELRKKNLKVLNDMDIQRTQMNAKLSEEQQLRTNKEKSIENLKSKNLELDVKLTKLNEEHELLKKDKLPESNIIESLKKAKLQLERELEVAKARLESCQGGEGPPGDRRVSVGGADDSPAGLQPPKFEPLYKPGSNATTPVINPEAVIDHDASSPKPSLTKSTKTVMNTADLKKPTQEAASPLETPLRQEEGGEMNRQIPQPPAPQPQQNVIRKPDYSADHGGEVGPMNPVKPAQDARLEEAKNKGMNAIAWEEDEGRQNGAHEEGEDERPGWRGGENEQNVLPRHINHNYPAEYEKDNQEEEEDEEGEQLDYVGGESVRRPKAEAKFRPQFERNVRVGGGVMLNPK